MKKRMSIIIAMLMAVMCFCSCGNTNDGADSPEPQAQADTSSINEDENDSSEAAPEVDADEADSFDVTKEEYVALSEEGLLNECFADKENPTEEELTRLFQYLRFEEIDYEKLYCIPEGYIFDAIRAVTPYARDYFSNPEFMDPLFHSDNPVIRGKAIEYSNSTNMDRNEFVKVAGDLLENETDLYVLGTILTAYSNDSAFSPEIYEFVKKMSDHENPLIRLRVSGVFDQNAKELDGIVDLALKGLRDEDDDVKMYFIKNAGKIGDPAILEEYKAIIADDSMSEELKSEAERAIGLYFE